MLRPADMAKIGHLYLRDGQWDGEQLMPPSWIEAATTTRARESVSPDG
jgi:CubicO group peptidase (beta-lactamase class C family)